MSTGARRDVQTTPLDEGSVDPQPFTLRGDARRSAKPAEPGAWTTVVRRRRGKSTRKTEPPARPEGHAAKPSAASVSGGSQKAPTARAATVATNAGGTARRFAQPKKSAPRRRRARQPRSAAIVLALPPGAAEKGITYAQVLTEVRDKIVLEDHGPPRSTYGSRRPVRVSSK